MTNISERPILNDPVLQAAAAAAVNVLLEDFQIGLDDADAERYDAHFAADVLWGSPFGATVGSFTELLSIHRALMVAHVAPRSRFEVVQLRAPAPGVAIVQIRRQAVAQQADGFSEMAMYVLIEREGTWWLAAAQNTPVSSPTSD